MGQSVGLVLWQGWKHVGVCPVWESPEHRISNFSECARPPAATEVKGWIYLQEQVLSRIEHLLKNCISREND